jgi:hypothetical protein
MPPTAAAGCSSYRQTAPRTWGAEVGQPGDLKRASFTGDQAIPEILGETRTEGTDLGCAVIDLPVSGTVVKLL